MNGLYVVLGAVFGLMLGAAGGNAILGLIAGLLIGWLAARTERLQQQLDEQADRIRRFQRRLKPAQEKDREPEPHTSQATQAWQAAPGWPPAEEISPEPLPGREPDGEPIGGEADSHTVMPPLETEPTPLERILAAARNWLTTGNIPVKVGVLVSFVGVSFLLKYAIDRNLFNMPIELRLVFVGLAGLAMMAVGWRLRSSKPVYALSLQGGGSGVLFLTVYAALRVWQLLPEPVAFVLLFALAALTGFLAVAQNARVLALFGIVGGFLAPVLTSTGEGSHVALFSYYLVLNLAILGIAWYRSWRVLNLVGFVFTFVISCFWGYRYFRPELFSTTEPFLILFFLFYQAIAVLYALRQPPERIGVVDGTLVFGTPIIAFGLQNTMLYGSEYGMAISAVALAVFYGLGATYFFRRKEAYLRLLTESCIALAVVFATLAIPLALDASWTSAAWALEGAALVWVGVRQRHHLANLAGFALLFLSGMAFTLHGWQDDAGLVLINGNVLGGLMISLSAFFSSRLLQSIDMQNRLQSVYRVASLLTFSWAVLWWLGVGWMEIIDRAPPARILHLSMLFMSLSTAAAIGVGRWLSWDRLRTATLLHLALLLPFAAIALLDASHFLLSAGWIAWPVAILVQAIVLYDMDRRRAGLAGTWHIVSFLLLVAMLAIEVHWRVDRVASSNWAAAASVSLPGLMALLLWQIRAQPAWPVPHHYKAYVLTSLGLVVAQVLYLSGLSLSEPGNPYPLPYLPLFNPFGLAMLFAALTAVMATRLCARESVVPDDWLPRLKIFFLMAFFVLTTAALVRAVHQFSDVPWRFNALFDSVMVQTLLSIYWGVLGFAGMVVGARKARHVPWIAGASLMGLVVVKLFLVDLGNSGTVERIVSFIGTGVLLLVVGYFAPAPPKEAERPS
jgi:uncharacterized membrane protein